MKSKNYRKRAVATNKLKYGANYYEEIGRKASTFKDRTLAKKSSWKYWKPERFDLEGNLLEEWQEEFEKGLPNVN